MKLTGFDGGFAPHSASGWGMQVRARPASAGMKNNIGRIALTVHSSRLTLHASHGA